ncbi:hypothetical protein LTR50_007286 [Elasticomyces elasticus]|nr:hypothetical protein LTR50_007286 [Elasticomyces elasticus]
MFSEYASRFLAQSQSHLSLGVQEHDGRNRNPLDRRQGAANPPSRRSYLQRPVMASPYQRSASQLSRFPFASRTSHAQAPLFFSATDEFQEENDGEAHEREVADFYALQRSRRHFGPSNLTESSEMEDDATQKAPDQGTDAERYPVHTPLVNESDALVDELPESSDTPRGRARTSRMLQHRDPSIADSEASAPSSKGKGRLVDVELASTIQEEDVSKTEDFSVLHDSPPPPFQQFRTSPSREPRKSSFLPRETDEEAMLGMPRPSSPGDSAPPTVILPSPEPPRHDQFFGSLYQISLFALVATFVLIWFHTSTPSLNNPLGDTVYSTLHSSFYLLLGDTLAAVLVALVWIALLRSYARSLVFLMLIAVPIILFSFSLYPLIWSFKGTWHGTSIQDRMMRWLSFIPATMAGIWIYSIYRTRHSLGRAIDILEFACKVLAASPALLTVGFGTLITIVSTTWVWMLMFTRVFLSGHFSKSKGSGALFILDSSTWIIGVMFVLQYLWTLSIIAGVQRATTAATVSQWYFHRNAVPAPTSRAVVVASLKHAMGPIFGTICFNTFLSLLLRLPLLVLPRRLASILSLCAYSLIPTSLATLTNPLTLTYAAIHSQPLGISARGLAQLQFVSKTSPTTTLSPNAFNPRESSNSQLVPYRLAKLLLHATRFIMSSALSFAAWVSTARSLQLPGGAGSTIRGSLYAYIVGLIAGTIGWAVLGSMEGVLSGIVDAGVICWASETGGRGGQARYCREAGELFGEEY